MLTVREALSIESLAETTIRAGKSGLEREISTVTIMDIPEIADWLTGGELLIAGVLFQQCFSREFVDILMQKGIAGIVTKKKFIEQIPPALFKYCDEIGFPVILAPADCNWVQIMNPILNYIVQKPYLIIDEAQKFHDMLMRAMIDGVSLSEICTKIHETAGLSLAVVDNDLYLVGFSDNLDWKQLTRNLNSGTMQYSGLHFETLDDNSVYIYSYTNLLLRSIQRKLLFYPVTLNHVKYGYVVLAQNDSIAEPNALELTKIQQFGLFVALNSTKQNEISNATRRFNGLLMDQLLQEADLSQERAEALLAPMGKKLHRQYYAVQFLYEETASLGSFVQRNNKIGQFHAQLEQKIVSSGHILIFETSNSQILLIPYPSEDLDTLLFQLRNIFLETTYLPAVYIGISDPTPLPEIKNAFQQSRHAANYSLSVKSDKAYCKYSDLGILKFFMDNEGRLDEHFLRDIYESYISPLLRHDKSHHTDLLPTLELYISNNCSKTNTEKQLFIHKNTLRARLSTINKILGCDVDNMEDLFKIQLALKLRYFFDAN
ncbi:MAG: PucR family transcriptional regulator ligand-binding domain-containing protein [Oscillospiraceae bacterium]